jgi:hypothetical protein
MEYPLVPELPLCPEDLELPLDPGGSTSLEVPLLPLDPEEPLEGIQIPPQSLGSVERVCAGWSITDRQQPGREADEANCDRT